MYDDTPLSFNDRKSPSIRVFIDKSPKVDKSQEKFSLTNDDTISGQVVLLEIWGY